MKERLILFCMLLLCGIGVSRAQSGNAKDFDQKEEAIVQKLQQAVNEKNYKEAEKNGKALITLFKEQDENTQKKYSWLIQSYYYNLACFQSLLKKKGEAIKNLELAYDNGFQDYNHMMNDTDLDNLRSDKRFKAVLAKVKKVGDYLDILQKTPGYTHNERPDTLPRFEYINPNNKYLVEVRQYFKLDSVAGAGDELSKIKNILTYIHNTIKHDGNHESPAGSNIIKWAEACKGGARGLHCGGLAHVLKDCYLSMGFKARHISGLPQKYIGECHSINVVYSNTLDKWIWVDPTNNAWVMDENGIMRTRDGRVIVGEGGPITVPPNSQVMIGEDGTVSAVQTDQIPRTVQVVDRIKLVGGAPRDLFKGEDGLFRRRDGQIAEADDGVRVATGMLEGSNVNPVDALTQMISHGRQFEFNVKLMQNADQNARRADQLLSITS